MKFVSAKQLCVKRVSTNTSWHINVHHVKNLTVVPIASDFNCTLYGSGVAF